MFFDVRKTPAVVKHGLLARYCPAFASKAGSLTGNRVTFLDGYAGAGCYEDGSPGSPTVLADAARSVSNNREVEAIFIEKDAATYAKLEQVLAQRCQGLRYVPLRGDVDDHLENVLAKCRDRALFAFFDPFGPALSRSRLCSMLKQRKQARVPTDVLLHISVRSVWNFGSRLTKAKLERRALDPRDEALARHLDRFLGDQRWRAEFEKAAESSDDEPDGDFKGERPAAVALRVAQDYSRRLAEETDYYTVSMPVRRTPKQVPIFVLALFTVHADGAWLFANCVGQAGLDWEEAWQRAAAEKEGPGGQTALFEGPEAWAFDRDAYEKAHQEEWISIIAQNVDQLLDQHHPLILQEHVAEIYGTSLGSGARETHARRAVKRLHNGGRVDHTGVGKYFYRDGMLRPSSGRLLTGLAG